MNTALAALQNIDANSAYCDHLLAELRELSPQNVRKLRQILSRTMLDFLEKMMMKVLKLKKGLEVNKFEFYNFPYIFLLYIL